MNTEKLIRELFVGKVAEIIGMERTVELLKETTDAIEGAAKSKQSDVGGRALPDAVESEIKLREMAELHKPKVENGKSDFYLAWRLCYEWMSNSNN